MLVKQINLPQQQQHKQQHPISPKTYDIVQNVFGGNRFGADARFGKGHVFWYARVQMVTHHEHVEMLVERVNGKRPGRIGRARQHVRFLYNLDNVGGMTTSRPFRVVRVDGPPLHSGNAVVDVTAFVERIRVNGHCHIVLVSKVKCGRNGRWRRSPILVQFKSSRAGMQHVQEYGRIGRVGLTGKAKVKRYVVNRTEHHIQLPRRGSAGRRTGASAGSGATTKHGGNARRRGLVNLLGTDPVHVRVNATGRTKELFSRNHLGGCVT
jgi:hypothetical protein